MHRHNVYCWGNGHHGEGNQKNSRGHGIAGGRQHQDGDSCQSRAGRRCASAVWGRLRELYAGQLSSAPCGFSSVQPHVHQWHEGTASSIIKVNLASKEEFATFCNLLGPWAWSTDKVTEANVDSLLPISNYYQVEIIKQTCEDLLLSLALTCARLLQADRHGLKRQYQGCMGHVAEKSTKKDLEVLRQSSPDILLQVALKQQDIMKALVRNRNQVIQYVKARTSNNCRETLIGVLQTMLQRRTD